MRQKSHGKRAYTLSALSMKKAQKSVWPNKNAPLLGEQQPIVFRYRINMHICASSDVHTGHISRNGIGAGAGNGIWSNVILPCSLINYKWRASYEGFWRQYTVQHNIWVKCIYSTCSENYTPNLSASYKRKQYKHLLHLFLLLLWNSSSISTCICLGPFCSMFFLYAEKFLLLWYVCG